MYIQNSTHCQLACAVLWVDKGSVISYGRSKKSIIEINHKWHVRKPKIFDCKLFVSAICLAVLCVQTKTEMFVDMGTPTVSFSRVVTVITNWLSVMLP